MFTMEPQIRFCRSADGTRIAYGRIGGGPGLPLFLVNGWAGSIELAWESPINRPLYEAISQDRLLVVFDRRYVGASERELKEESFSLQTQVDDLTAVISATGADSFHLMGIAETNGIVATYAVANPDLVSRIVMASAFADTKQVGSKEAYEATAQMIRANYSMARRTLADLLYPSGPDEMRRWAARFLKEAVPAETAARYVEYEATINIADTLEEISNPTLVIHHRRERYVPIKAGRRVATLVKDAQFVVQDGDMTGWDDETSDLIREFLAQDDPVEAQTKPRPMSAANTSFTKTQKGLTVLLFTDIANSTGLTESLGDAAFRDKARRLDNALRTAIVESGGKPIEGKLLGDGVLATFDSARDAIAAALECAHAGENHELSLHLGIHAGDVIREDQNVFGGAVNIAARIAAESPPGEVLVSQTIRDLARTSAGVGFEDIGERALKGVSDPVRLWRVARE